MKLKKILPSDPEVAIMDEVNLEAFPRNERMDTEFQTKLCSEGKLDVWGVWDEEEFVGYSTVYPGKVLSYVFFLAVHSKMRSNGYGSRILNLLRKQYPDKKLVLDIEPTDSSMEAHAISYEENQLRLRRKAFYLRNGFRESGYLIKYLGMTFEILYDGSGEFIVSDLNELMLEVKELIWSCGLTMFEPEISPIL